MTTEMLEKLMTDMNLKFSRVIKNMWSIQDHEDKLPPLTMLIEASEKKGSQLLKFMVFICDVPAETDPVFLKEFLRMNFLVEHGTFAMETRGEMSFIDTIELDNLDPDEFIATLNAVRGAPAYFKQKYDTKDYTFGNALY